VSHDWNTTSHLVIATSAGVHVSNGEDGAALLAGEAVTAIDGAGDDLWVLAGRRHLYRVTTGTAERVASLEGDARGTCLGVHTDTVWVGGDRAHLWRLVGSRLEEVTAFGEAPTNDEWHTPWGGPPDVFSMASYGDDLYVSVHVGGIRTSDGEVWEPTIDLHDDVHQVAVGPDGTVWAATGRRGLAESRDRGSTWRYHRDGLHATYLLAVAASADGVLVGASSGRAGRDGAVYRFDGQRFTRGAGLSDDFAGAVGPRQLAAVGELSAVALPSGDVYMSDDGGEEWGRAETGLPGISEIIYSHANGGDPGRTGMAHAAHVGGEQH
jgi:hypothetical protein